MPVPTNLFISEYIEGSSNNKAVEIYNGTGAAIDLAAGNYVIQVYNNGSATPTSTIALTGTIANGDVFVLANTLAAAAVLAAADQTSGSVNFNGDDAVVLRQGGASGTILDVIGQIGFDPGTEWGAAPNSTLNSTLVRNSTISQGDTDGSNAFVPATEWTGSAQDTFTGLGSHTFDPGDSTPPTLSTSSPADDATGVAAGANIVLTFDENVQMVAAGGAIELRRSSDNSLVESFTSANVGGTVTIAGAVLTINPTADLLAGEGYYINVAANAVEDTAGNDFAGIAGTTALNFTAAAGATAALSIDDVSIVEGDAGTSILTFTVTRSNNTTDFTVDFASADGTATTADNDYAAAGGTLTFTAGGALTQTVSVTINGDTAIEANETLNVNLSNIVNGTGTTTFTDASGLGTITNDDLAPSVSINSVSVVEGNAGTQTLTFTVIRTGGSGAFAVDFATADGTALSASDYVANSGTLNFGAGENLKTIDITINGDIAAETNEAFTVALSNATAGAVIGTGTGTGTINNDDFTLIHDIQGAAHLSAMAGTSRSVEGIVTGIFSNGTARGYYVQEEDTDADADIGTSEGIFVFTGGVSPTVAVGDKVQVTGTVAEFRGAGPAPQANNLTLTQLTAATATVISSGNALPTAIVVGDAGRNPVSSVLGDDPETGVFNAATEAIDFWESLEGMRVTLDNPTAAGPFRNNFGEIMVLPNGGEADSLNARGGVTIRETSAPGTNPAAQTFDFNGERIQIDDNLDGGSTAALTSTITVGDQYADITGIVSYGFGFYEVNINYALTTQTASTLTQESTTLTTQPERIRMASFNVENLSPVGTLFSAGQTTTQQKFDDLAAAIVNRLGAPELIALQEVQDNDGITGGTGSAVTSASATLTALLAAINAAGGPQYTAIDAPPAIAHDEGGAPGGNIRVAYLYRADVLAPVTALTDVAANVKQYNGPRIGDGNADFAATRHSVPIEWRTVADALQAGSTFWTINNHFSSKNGSGTLTGTQADGPLWDEPVNISATKREGQAIAVNTFIDGILGDANTLNDRIMTVGDFNDFQFFPVTGLVSGALTRLTAGDSIPGNASTFALGTAVMTSMMMSLPEAERYTYSFDGNAQALDHILVTNNLFASTQLDIIHMNSEFNSATQLSDHDPSEISFLSLTSLALATAGADVLNEAAYIAAYGAEFGSLAGANRIDALAGNDLIVSGSGNDTIFGGAGDDRVYGGTGNDSIDGGADRDFLDHRLSTTAVTVSLDNSIGGQEDFVANIEILGGSNVGNDSLRGDGNTNWISGFDGDDTIEGGGGDDILVGGAGADSIDGGGGRDFVDYRASAAGVTIALDNSMAAAGGEAAGDTFNSIEMAAGSQTGDDSITGDGQVNWLFGFGGADTLNGGGGDDLLYGGAGADSLDGGAGRDFADYRAEAAGVTIALDNSIASAGGEAAGDTFTSIEIVSGSLTGADSIVGDSFTNYLLGHGGDDTLDGADGDDLLYGGAGADRITGGAGRDFIDYRTEAAGVTLALDNSFAALGGEAAGDTFFFIELVAGSLAGADSITGDANDNWLQGFGGNDTLAGGGGRDFLYAGSGNDMLTGGAGSDIFTVDATGGAVVVTDFNATDIDYFDFRGSGFADAAAALAAAATEGADVRITIDGDTSVLLQNTSLAALNTSFFFA